MEGLSRFDGYAFVNFGVQQGLPHPVSQRFSRNARRGILDCDRRRPGTVRSQGHARCSADHRPRRRGPASAGISRCCARHGTAPSGWERTRASTGSNERPPFVAGRRDPDFRTNMRSNASSLTCWKMPMGLCGSRRPAACIAGGQTAARPATPRVTACRTTSFRTCSMDHEGSLWVGHGLEGFFRFSADATRRPPVVDLKFTYHPHDPYGVPWTSWVSQLFESSDRRFLVATPRGLVEFFRGADGKAAAFVPIPQRQRPEPSRLTTLVEDLGGNLWLGTMAGAMKLARVGFSTYGEQDGIGRSLRYSKTGQAALCFRGSVLGDATKSCLRRSEAGPVWWVMGPCCMRGSAVSMASVSTGSSRMQ